MKTRLSRYSSTAHRDERIGMKIRSVSNRSSSRTRTSILINSRPSIRAGFTVLFAVIGAGWIGLAGATATLNVCVETA